MSTEIEAAIYKCRLYQVYHEHQTVNYDQDYGALKGFFFHNAFHCQTFPLVDDIEATKKNKEKFYATFNFSGYF